MCVCVRSGNKAVLRWVLVARRVEAPIGPDSTVAMPKPVLQPIVRRVGTGVGGVE